LCSGTAAGQSDNFDYSAKVGATKEPVKVNNGEQGSSQLLVGRSGLDSSQQIFDQLIFFLNCSDIPLNW